MSFPPGTEMFQFPGFASPTYVFSERYPKGVGCPIRISTDQSLLAAPHGFSQRATSFIASWCQGIHRMPFSYSITNVSHPSSNLPSTPSHQTSVVRPQTNTGLENVRPNAAVSPTQHNSHNAPDHYHRIKRDDPCRACTRHDPFRSDKSPNAATDQSCHRPNQRLRTSQTATELLQRTQGRTRTRFTTQKNKHAGHSPSGNTAMPTHPTLSGAGPTSRRSRIQPIRHTYTRQPTERRPRRDNLIQGRRPEARRLAWRLSDSNR